MAWVMARSKLSWLPPATSVARPTCRPLSRNLLIGATPEARFMFDSGEWAMNTPFFCISACSSSFEWTQCAMMHGYPPPNMPNCSYASP